MRMTQTRRQFLTTLSLGGAVGLVGSPPLQAAEGPPETTSVRLPKQPTTTCLAPQYIAEELLRAEGFTEIHYVELSNGDEYAQAFGRNVVDFAQGFAADFVTGIDAGDPITLLSGVHVGCVEVFGNESIPGITDLKGKRVGVPFLGSTAQILVSLMAAQVGLDPAKEIHWITSPRPSADPMELFIDGKIDAFLAVAPWSQEVRARRIGHVFVNSALDRPWSQYFCCMLAGHRDFVRKYPVATKRVLRAILKAADLCAIDPAGAAQRLVNGGIAPRYDYAFQALSDLPYDKWREYDPEDTLRFYALRMREAGFIKSSPQKIIADGTDWRFLNEVKHELKE